MTTPEELLRLASVYSAPLAGILEHAALKMEAQIMVMGDLTAEVERLECELQATNLKPCPHCAEAEEAVIRAIASRNYECSEKVKAEAENADLRAQLTAMQKENAKLREALEEIEINTSCHDSRITAHKAIKEITNSPAPSL